ncbi:MAG: LuxR C-terminal-related transcriptional regulator [Achromobacter veterisilvae]
MNYTAEQLAHTGLLMDLLPIGMVLSSGRRISRGNAIFADIFGYCPDDLIGKSWEMLFPSHHDFVELGDCWRGILSRDGQYCDERIMLRKNQEPVNVRVRGKCQDRRDPYLLLACTLELASSAAAASFSLSAREREIIDAMSNGLTSKQIGLKLGISHRTVETYRARLMTKVGARNATQLLALAS